MISSSELPFTTASQSKPTSAHFSSLAMLASSPLGGAYSSRAVTGTERSVPGRRGIVGKEALGPLDVAGTTCRAEGALARLDLTAGALGATSRQHPVPEPEEDVPDRPLEAPARHERSCIFAGG